jgi:hypothetical protein
MNPPAISQSEFGGLAALGMTLSRSITRRDAMRVGFFSTAGLLFSGSRAAAATTPAPQALDAAPFKTKAKSVIQVFLWGGMSHNDTWDPKPDAGYDYNGPMKAPLSTNVAGMQLSEWFPKLAQQADKFSLIRSMTHGNNGHETAAYLVQTAHQPGERLAYPSAAALRRAHAAAGALLRGRLPRGKAEAICDRR